MLRLYLDGLTATASLHGPPGDLFLPRTGRAAVVSAIAALVPKRAHQRGASDPAEKGGTDIKRTMSVAGGLEDELSRRALCADEVWFSRETAFLALGMICSRGDPSAVVACLGGCADPDPLVRVAAVRALGGVAPQVRAP